MDVRGLVEAIDTDLRAHASPERAEGAAAYLQHRFEHYGASVPAVREVARYVHRWYPDLTHDDLLALVDALWAAPVFERRLVTVELLVLHVGRLVVADVALLERLLREAGTWAVVDPLAIGVVGALCEHHPELVTVLDRWAVDHDFWVRRAALLALLVPLRRGDGDFDRFCRYADTMLAEREFFIRKAIGWVLRDTGRKRPDLVYDWLLPRAGRASGVTLREAVKPLSEEQRTEILAAR